MNKITDSRVLKVARSIQQSWKRAALFIASPEGFYFDTVEEIITNKGKIKPFKHPKINSKIQAQYLELINEFIA